MTSNKNRRERSNNNKSNSRDSRLTNWNDFYEVEPPRGLQGAIGDFGITWNNERFGISARVLGIGLSIDTGYGGTVGVDLGIIGVELSRDGGGWLSYLWGLYEMEAIIDGCSLIKLFYIKGIFIRSEVQRIPGCDQGEPIEIADKEYIDKQEYTKEELEALGREAIDNLRQAKEAEIPSGRRFVYLLNWRVVVAHTYVGDKEREPNKRNWTHVVVHKVNNFHMEPDVIYFSEPRMIDGKLEPFSNVSISLSASYTSHGELISEVHRNESPGEEIERMGLGQILVTSIVNAASYFVAIMDRKYLLDQRLASVVPYYSPPFHPQRSVQWTSVHTLTSFRVFDVESGRTYTPSRGGSDPRSRGRARRMKDHCCFTEDDRVLLARTALAAGAIDTFPVQTPVSLQGNNRELKKINNIPEYIDHLQGILDETLGQYPIDLKIPDENGKLESKSLPNIAETLAEIYGFQIQDAIDRRDKRLEIGTAVEIELIKKKIFQMKYQNQAIIDFLDFEETDTRKRLKYAFNPSDPENFLERSQEEVEVVEFRRDKKNPSLRTIMDELLQGAVTIRQAFGISIDPSNVIDGLISFFKGFSDDKSKMKQFEELLESGKLNNDNIGIGDNPRFSNPDSAEKSES